MRDSLFLVLLLALAFLSVYFFPVYLALLVFTGLSIAFYFDKRDHIWLFFFLLLEDQPGGLFCGGAVDEPMRLPLFKLFAGVSLTVTDVFLIVFILKILTYRKRKYYAIKNQLYKFFQILLILFFLELIVTFGLGTDKEGITTVIKTFLALTLFYNFQKSFSSMNIIERFFRLVFPFAFIAIILQSYILINGHYLVTLFKDNAHVIHGSMDSSNMLSSTEQFVRPIEIPHVLFLIFTGSLFFLARGNKTFNSNYLIIVNVLSFFSLLLSGTRGWFLGFVFGYIIYFIYNSGVNTIKMLRVFILGILTIIVLVFNSPVISNQLENAWIRISTLGQIVSEGGMQESSARERYDVAAPRVMIGFAQSTIILGAGFSKIYSNYWNAHVGYHTLLLNLGIFGFILFFWTYLNISIKPLLISKVRKKGYEIGLISLAIVFIINFGVFIIGYSVIFPRIIITAVIFALINYLLQEIRSSESQKFV